MRPSAAKTAPLLWALLVVLGGPARGEIKILLEPASLGSDMVPARLELLGREGDVLWSARTTAPGSATIETLPPQAEVLRIDAPPYWTAPLELSSDQKDLRVTLWPATTIEGRLRFPSALMPPSSVALTLRPHDPLSSPAPPSATLRCPADDEGEFQCSVPAAPGLDLRFRVPGFASRFFWNVDLGGEDRVDDVGTLLLNPGGSVVGQVLVNSRDSPEEVTLLLTRARDAPTSAGKVSASDVLETHPNQYGHFSYEGLGPGIYHLVASHPDLGGAERSHIRVAEGAQTELTDPLVLEPKVPLKVSVEPPFDPREEEWRVRLYTLRPTGERGRSPAFEAAASAGYLEAETLGTGRYEIQVLDSRDHVMLTSSLEHQPSSGIHAFEVESIRVDGLVTLADEPLVSKVTFRRPKIAVDAETDAEGVFHAYLPGAGTWDVAVTAPVPAVEWRERYFEIEGDGSSAEIVIELPDTELSGLVVDTAGNAQVSASVEVRDTTGYGLPVSLRTDSSGEVTFHGLAEGTYRVAASLDDLQSETEVVEIREESAAGIRLVLLEQRRLTGRVVAPNGDAVPGAWLYSSALDPAGRALPFDSASYSADSSGAFELRLPPRTATVATTAFASGLASRSEVFAPGDVGDVVLGSSGGSLTLRLDEPMTADVSGPLPIVVMPNGQRMPLPALAYWARIQGIGVDPRSSEMTIPGLGPGSYRACWTTAAELTSRPQPGSRCVDGVLGAGGDLVLHFTSTPSPESADRASDG